MESVTTSNTLLDMLGVLIGFSTVMLLLSLLVTSLVQLFSAVFQMRSGNLMKGIVTALEDAQIGQGDDARTLARRLLVKPTSPNRGAGGQAPSGVTGFYDRLSWVEMEDLSGRLKELIPETVYQAAAEKFTTKFKAMQSFLSKRFALHSRFVSVGFAALVAIVLQVNALDLFRELSINAEMREKFIAGSEMIMGEYEAADKAFLSGQEITDLALSQMGEKHPALDTVFEQVFAPDNTTQSIVEEFKTVMTLAVPDSAAALTDEFGTILNDLWVDQSDKAWEETKKLTGHLAYFNLDIVPYGSRWYCNWTNIIGLLVTIIFVSLGSPFWFKWLSFLSGLRDALKPKKEDEEDND